MLLLLVLLIHFRQHLTLRSHNLYLRYQIKIKQTYYHQFLPHLLPVVQTINLLQKIKKEKIKIKKAKKKKKKKRKMELEKVMIMVVKVVVVILLVEKIKKKQILLHHQKEVKKFKIVIVMF